MLSDWIIEQASDALIFADRDGTVARWNRAATKLFGYTAEEALGQNLDIVIPERLRKAHWNGFDAAVASGTMKLGGRPTLTRAAHKDGRKLYVELSFALIKDTAGHVAGSVAIARDVTDRVERDRRETAGSGISSA